jgi:ArsR family transcriptional regulator, arsenate/arsenite/antimonite-responsive transcriptional repressor / arsenate reductase (thioredoxin)
VRVGTARRCSVQLPPVVFQLAGHPLRWRLLRELASSDRRVRELMDSLGEPQSLVSYHLRRLRAADLVSVRRSSFDGRDGYYNLNLGRCGELLADAGAALHPALRLSPHSGTQPRRRSRRVRVLFLCTGNSARSQIAEGLLQELSGSAVEAFSAGSRPKSLHPNAVRVMRVRGIDISERRPKHLNTFSRRRLDYVVSLCDRVREVCRPQFPGDPQTIHWSIPDPAVEPGGDADTYPAFERTAAELETRIRFLLHRINNDTPNKEVSRS